MRTEVVGHGGVRLGLRVEGAGNERPLVFVHGWAHSATVWSGQLADPALSERFRLVAMDLRGHGASDVPATGYDDPHVWADDLAAVLDFAGPGAIVVASSYAGLVVADHVRVHGTGRIGGIVLVGAITEIGRGHEGGRIGPAMRAALPAALHEEPVIAVPALIALSAEMTARPLPGTLAQLLLGSSLSVPPAIRAALFRRDVGNEDVLARIDVPTLVVHGTADQVVEPSAGEYAAGKIPGASMRWFVDAGHLPFVEAAGEFGSALRQFSADLPA